MPASHDPAQASASPSGANIQPWRVYVVTGQAKDDRRLKPHSWIDLGLFAQTLMIAAKSRGIDTCPQVSFAPFHEVIAAHLGMPAEEVTAFGMSMGYGDHEEKVNQTSMPRERVQDFARLLGFPAELPLPAATGRF